MELIPKEIEAIIPLLYSQETVPDPVAVIKLFGPCGRYTLYVLEGSRHPDGDLLLFGFCVSPLGPDCDELGYASLRQLESVRGPLRLGIERDLYFKPTPLSQIRGKSSKEGGDRVGKVDSGASPPKRQVSRRTIHQVRATPVREAGGPPALSVCLPRRGGHRR